MSKTQEHLSISDIKNDIIFLKDGGGALVLQVSAVNFGLLSEKEQVAIITAFAQMLNSLSFSIQIVIHSQRLNISSYLNLLDEAQKAQTNPLLKSMISSYRQFVQTLIKENEVLDKKFYIAIPLFSLEVGLTSSKESLSQKIKTVLIPRRDQVIRQLQRVGLKANQLTTQQLVELFYDLYNGLPLEEIVKQPQISVLDVKLNPPQNIQPKHTATAPPKSQSAQITTPISSQLSKTHPFVVEELEDT